MEKSRKSDLYPLFVVACIATVLCAIFIVDGGALSFPD